MLKNLGFVLLVIFSGNFLFAQDTLRIQRPEDDRYCTLLLCTRDGCFADSIPLEKFSGEGNVELRINDRCDSKKHYDVFVTSFEITTITDTLHSNASQSSFFTGTQKKMISRLKKGDAVTIKNIAVHAPDGFKKIEPLQIIIK
jgi:hypothetical protein